MPTPIRTGPRVHPAPSHPLHPSFPQPGKKVASASGGSRTLILLGLVGVTALVAVISVVVIVVRIGRAGGDDAKGMTGATTSSEVDPELSRIHKVIWETERSARQQRGQEKLVTIARASVYRAIMDQAATYEHHRDRFNNSGGFQAATLDTRELISSRRKMVAEVVEHAERFAGVLSQVPTMYDEQMNRSEVGAATRAAEMEKFTSRGCYAHLKTMSDEELVVLDMYAENLKLMYDYFDSMQLVGDGRVWFSSERALEQFRRTEQQIHSSIDRIKSAKDSLDSVVRSPA
jgi:hypothetical protein